MTDPSPPPSVENLGEGRWRDTATGLVVVPAPTGPLHRVPLVFGHDHL